MSGSVPIAFSLLGDLFSAEERNAASSVLTAMMGCGILMGQVYAGVVGGGESEGGWSQAFFVSSGLSVISALLVLIYVQEPVRGGKEVPRKACIIWPLTCTRKWRKNLVARRIVNYPC